MLNPADVCQRALDQIGSTATLGDPDLGEGTRESEACRRIYGPTLRQLLRAALWNFARRQANLTLLQDATGQSPAPAGIGTPGMGPWRYEYAWPIDCVRLRFVPLNVPPTNPPSTTPLMTGLATAAPLLANIPGRFVVSQDVIPNILGAITDWNQLPDLDRTMGQGLSSQSVILTNIPNASAVYTGLATFPGEWDALFQEAMVAALGERLAMPCLQDKKFALAMRGQQILAAKAALMAARISDGDEGWNLNSHIPDWIRTRRGGFGWNGWYGPSGPWGDGAGMLYQGWSQYAFSDGSAY